jgi:hypothetical protein
MCWLKNICTYFNLKLKLFLRYIKNKLFFYYTIQSTTTVIITNDNFILTSDLDKLSSKQTLVRVQTKTLSSNTNSKR